MLEAIENIASMKVVDPPKILFFSVVPRSVWQLVLGGVAESFLCKISVGLIARVRISPRKKAAPSVLALCTRQSKPGT